ncbi:MAG: hypothetical protein SFU87_17430 [Chitinophagaceae bacterium]|nr:hypothetical protein [Chitinophagaceae bacterium]
MKTPNLCFTGGTNTVMKMDFTDITGEATLMRKETNSNYTKEINNTWASTIPNKQITH